MQSRLRRMPVKTPLLLALCLVIGCDGPDDRICLTPPEPRQGDVEGCVHRWAYRLARSPEPSEQIATSVVAGCDDAIMWRLTNGPQAVPPEALDQLYAASKEGAREKALFHITQAKAGNCEVPG